MNIIDVPDKPVFQIAVCPHIWTDFVMKNTATEISNLFITVQSLFIVFVFILILTLNKLQKLFHFLGCLTLIAV